MRAMRPSLVVMSSVVLSFGLATTATAQEEPAPVTFVTGTVAEAYGYDVGGTNPHIYEIRGWDVMEQQAPLTRQVVEWSDPRLPPDHWLALALTVINPELPSGELVVAGNVAFRSLLEDEQGRWRGAGRMVGTDGGTNSLYVLTGEGAYEGLSALLYGVPPRHPFGAPWEMAYEGYIFEAELTPFPDEPVPVTTGAYQVWPPPTE